MTDEQLSEELGRKLADNLRGAMAGIENPDSKPSPLCCRVKRRVVSFLRRLCCGEGR